MSDAKSILMVAPQPFFSARGTPFSVLHRIRALIELGHRVDLVTYGYGEDIDMPGLRIFRTAKLPGVSKVKLGPSIPKIFLDMLLYGETRKLLRANRYDVLHSHEEAAFFAVGLCKRHGLPHLYDMHSSLPLQLSNFKSFNLGIFRTAFERLEHRVLSTCDAVITICDELAQIVEPNYPDVPHAMIENIGEDRKVFSRNTRDWGQELAMGDGPVLLYTGTFEAYQGIDLFLDAMPRVLATYPHAIALLVGGNPAQVDAARARATSLGIVDNVRFTGTVHPSNIPPLTDLSTLIVSPRSRGTNTPLKIYNYMRTGKPLVATDRLTHTQTLTPETACLVPADTEGFAAGITRVLDAERGATGRKEGLGRHHEDGFR
ncbi:MAG: glycosyltransferase family 4 protein, partial [Pseudomonadota bacterium]